ncbi:MAG: acyl-CoA dehydrogenase [Acidimicrobiia bacterium]|nr:MAG: acyl-CoA dehydrogenase [Acidimicrobiia bacterium]
MNFSFTEEQEELRSYVRRWLEEKHPTTKVRELMETDRGYDPAQWKEIAGLGWQGTLIPEEYGGSGFGFLELVILLEEQGRALFCAPFFSTAVLATNALLLAGSDDQKSEWLPRIAAGDAVATVALVEPGRGWDPEDVETSARRDGEGWVIQGVKSYVLDGHVADLLITSARTDHGLTLFCVPADSDGVTRRRLETMDMTRKQAEVVFDGVRVPDRAVLGEVGGARPVLDRLADLASVALAAEQVGGAERCMEMAVEYAKVRHQFGRPIGSFQAIKHKCADMLVQVESARSAAYYAGWAAAEDEDELRIVAPLAKSYCSEAYFFCAAENIQVHGGIGFTWEHDAHLYFKRAKSSELMFGDPAYHREILAARLGL